MASNEQAVWRRHGQEAKRGETGGQRIPWHGEAIASFLLPWVVYLQSAANSVAYLSPADNVLRPLLCYLREVSQPGMSPPNPFSTPRLRRLACRGAHRAALH